MKLLICMNCKYCVIDTISITSTQCLHNNPLKINYITGQEYTPTKYASHSREGDEENDCGEEAKYFVKKDELTTLPTSLPIIHIVK